MRLALVISQLGPGGAERVMSELAGAWAHQGHDVSLITLSTSGEDFYNVPPKVRRTGLGMMEPSCGKLNAIRNNLRRLRMLRATILAGKPDCVVSFTDKTNVLVLLAMSGCGIPVVVSERIDPRQYPIGRVWSALRKLLYRRAAGLVVQTESLRPWAEGQVGRGRVHVVPNPVWIRKRDGDDRDLPVGRPFVMGMGRLTHQKGFDLLVEAFARVLQGHDDGWSLAILGEGECRGELEAMARELGLSGRVVFPGVVGDPGPWLGRADLFVLSSRYEGYPNALLEAMAHGRACVSFDCPSGPGEIITDGVDGILVSLSGGKDELARVMADLMASADARERLGRAASQSVSRFAVERIGALWTEIFQRVTSNVDV